MYYYKASLQYIGTNYFGFQYQKALKTVQGEINLAISKILKGKFSTVASSRTDTGVHANIQILKITTEHKINLDNFIHELNRCLPDDINFLSVEETQSSFKPTMISSSKEYRYFFTNEKVIKKENLKLLANISQPLDIQAIQKCLKYLIGLNNFQNFYSTGSNIRSTKRKIIECDLSLISPQQIFTDSNFFQFEESISQVYQLRIKADGFLKQMIRHIVSALWMVGTGKLSEKEFLELLTGPKSQKQKWKIAPANGLIFYKIYY